MSDDSYNWIDDPFDEKKAQPAAQQSMTGASKLAVVLGCLGIVVVFALILVFGIASMVSVFADLG